MPREVELKLQDLARIALGVPKLTNANIAVLHSLIDILLKKLNCQNETVPLGAHGSKQLQKILEFSKITPLTCNDENIDIISDKLERLQKLEEHVNELDTKLEKHLEELERQSNHKDEPVNWDTWESYGCKDLCTICDDENDLTCKLLQNTDFLTKLLRRISSPMVDRMFYFEEKLQRLHEEFLKFIKRAEEEYLKIQLLEKCILEIEILRKKINENQTLFLGTMEEIQDMLDAKADKIHMPVLKKYIRDNFHSIDHKICELLEKTECPNAAGIIMQGIRCLSCGDTKVCTDVGVQPAGMLPDMRIAQKTKQVIKYYGCTKEFKNHGPSTARSLNLSDVIDVTLPKIDSESGPPKCGSGRHDFDLMEGFDGNLYRKG